MRRRNGGYHTKPKEQKPDGRCGPGLGDVIYTTYEEEKAHLLLKCCNRAIEKVYLPSLAEIEAAKEEIKQDNMEMELQNAIDHPKRKNPTETDRGFSLTYRMILPHSGGRHGKII